MSSQLTFHPFPRLPFEIRHAIWKLCVPHRVVDLDDLPWAEDMPETKCEGSWATGTKNDIPPRIARVCQEARAVCRERDFGIEDVRFWPLMLMHERDRIEYDSRHWFNPSNDIVHMNWTPYIHIGCEHDSYLPDLLRVSYQGKASIAAGLVYPYDFPVGPTPSYFFFCDDQQYDCLELLDTRKDYLLVMTMVNIHATMELALKNGAFGRLGEELYVLVRPSEEEKFRNFYELWSAASPEDREAKQFLEQASDSSATRLKREVEK